MLIVEARHGKLKKLEWNKIHAVLRRGAVVVYPTDTAYGLAVDPRVSGAVKKIFAIKGRNENKPLSVAVASTAMAKRYGIFSPLATRLARQYWPGALMLVVPLRKTKEVQPLRSLGGGNTVGLRYPDHPIAVALSKKLGYPITSTSANRSGASVCYSMREFMKQMKHAPVVPDLFINAGALPRRPTSTVVDCTGKNPKILRQGSVVISH